MTAQLSLLVCGAVLFFLLKKTDPRLCLLSGGFALFAVQGSWKAGLDAFANAMSNAPMIEAVCSSMGFAGALKASGCDRALVERLAMPIRRCRSFLPVGAVLIAFVINIALPSGAGAAAAVSTTLIPLLLRAGVSPRASAAAILLGTFGSMLSPGLAHNAIVAEIVGISIHETILFLLPSTLLALAVVAAILLILMKLGKDFSCESRFLPESRFSRKEPIHSEATLLKAVAPAVPLAILLAPMLFEGFSHVSIGGAMLFGTLFAAAAAAASPQKMTEAFFTGMGKGFANVFAITLAASVFAQGLQNVALFREGISALAESASVLPAAGLTAFLFSAASGSSDAVTYALNQLVTAHPSLAPAEQLQLGTFVTLSAQLGRLASPYSGAAMLLAQMCGIRSTRMLRLTVLPLIAAFCAVLLLQHCTDC